MSSTGGRRERMLREMGLGPIWRQRHVAQAPSTEKAGELEPDSVPPSLAEAQAEVAGFASADQRAQSIAAMSWEELEEAVAGCTACDLCRTRTRTVFGTGDRKASWLFVGEGPGYHEDKQGEPFVGLSGKLLDNLMAELGVGREHGAFIANIVKCRATDASGNDRPPSNDEAAACRPYLQRQIELLNPAAMVALGKTAAFSLLGGDPSDPKAALGSLRGKRQEYRHGDQRIPVTVTYHPAYLLRRPAEKAKAWADLCMAMVAHEHPG